MANAPKQIVILGTGRSFTSVVSCMLGQHPDMIGLPETNIFIDSTLGQATDRFNLPTNQRRRSGILRTLAHFHDGAQTDETIAKADKFIKDHADWTSKQIADYITGLAAPRGIVEKSISTCRNLTTARRALEAWPDAYFLHITRQPESIVASMGSRIDASKEKGKGKRRGLGEFAEEGGLYKYFNQLSTTILEFMSTLRQSQGMNLHGENFLSDARFYSRQICEWVGLDSSDAAIEEMMHPENNPFAFPGPQSAPGGMSKSFLENSKFSGKPVVVKPMTLSLSNPDPDLDRQVMATYANRLGYS